MQSLAVNHQGSHLRIGVVQARFTDEIGTPLRQTCIKKLLELGVAENNITVATVPGALEVPLVLQNLAATGNYDALIALGVIIRGETYHFELVANESGAAITRVGLDFNIPIANAILTTENDEQAIARIVKGEEAAVVAVELANLLAQINVAADEE